MLHLRLNQQGAFPHLSFFPEEIYSDPKFLKVANNIFFSNLAFDIDKGKDFFGSNSISVRSDWVYHFFCVMGCAYNHNILNRISWWRLSMGRLEAPLNVFNPHICLKWLKWGCQILFGGFLRKRGGRRGVPSNSFPSKTMYDFSSL